MPVTSPGKFIRNAEFLVPTLNCRIGISPSRVMACTNPEELCSAFRGSVTSQCPRQEHESSSSLWSHHRVFGIYNVLEIMHI